MARGGPRPNSGRGTILDDRKLADILNASSEITLRYLNDETISISQRVEVASRLIAKRIPQDIQMSGEMSHNLFMQSLIEKSRNPT